MSWFRRNWRWVLLSVVGVLGLGLVLLLYALSKKKEADKLRAELAMAKAAAKVDGLLAEEKARASELSKNAEEKQKLDAEIAEAKKQTVAVVEDVANLTDAQVAERFAELGY